MWRRGRGWVGLGWVKASSGHAAPLSALKSATKGPHNSRLSGLKAYWTVDRPRTPRWQTREGDAAVLVCVARMRAGGAGTLGHVAAPRLALHTPGGLLGSCWLALLRRSLHPPGVGLHFGAAERGGGGWPWWWQVWGSGRGCSTYLCLPGDEQEPRMRGPVVRSTRRCCRGREGPSVGHACSGV